MTDTTRFLRPELRFDCSLPDPGMLPAMAFGLTTVRDARREELVGFALGHGIGPLYPQGIVTEYLCAFVGTGDGRSCDGRAFQLEPKARCVLEGVMSDIVHGSDLTRDLRQALRFPDGTFETIHFRDFTVAMFLGSGQGPDAQLTSPQILMDRPRSAKEARQRIAAITALFRFLGEWHTILSPYSIDLTNVEALLVKA